jgi:hypothetical protein
MKIALLMSGKLGKFFHGNRLSSHWSSIVKNYGIDVFLVTDDDNYFNPINNSQVFSIKNKDRYVTNNDDFRRSNNYTYSDYSETSDLLNRFLGECFSENLKHLSILDSDLDENFLIKNNSQKTFFDYSESGRGEGQKLGLLNQFFKLEKCYEAMCEYENENSIEYDIVIRSRFDCTVHFNTSLDLQNIIYCGYSGQNKHIFDWWAIGDRKIMGEYCKYYTKIGDYLIEGKKSIIPWNGHNLDISDSSEVGLTDIIHKNSYSISDTLYYDIDKSY